jgi:hypothetical protein
MAIMKTIDVGSTIAGFGYDPTTQVASVQFKRRGEPDSTVYHYQGVEPEVGQQIEAVASAGESPGSLIRSLLVQGGYEFEKIEVAQPGEGGAA